jgi:Domain of unknown function (DUF5060)/Putative collagen-binding domain of a collagenase
MRFSALSLLCALSAVQVTTTAAAASLFDLFGSAPSAATTTTSSAPAESPVTEKPIDSSSVITDFVLVNTKTGQDITLMEEGMKIDLGTMGDELTIRVVTVSSYTDSFVKMDLDDGKLRRVEAKAPYYLAGNDDDNVENGQVFSSYTIAQPGPHILVACPNDSGLFTPPTDNHATAGGRRKLEDHPDCLAIRFETVVGTAAVPQKLTPDESPDMPQPLPQATSDVEHAEADMYGVVTGELLQWHTVTVGFSGPPASETGMTLPGAYRAPSTFADYLLDCTFEHAASNAKFVVPGYYAGDGKGANQLSIGGNIWYCHFTPPTTGLWSWKTKYAQGTNVAQNGGGNPGGFFDGASGTMDIVASDKTGRDFRGLGRVVAKNGQYVFPNGQVLRKVGPSSPTNLLDYADFDAAKADAKTYSAHVADYTATDPTFADGKGKGLIGALNYLSSKGVTSLAVTTFDVQSGVFPFLLKFDNQLQYDLSKIAQWQVVLEHANKVGIALTIKLQSDDDDLNMNQGKLFEERKLYYREMIARFGHHLAVTWDLGLDLTPEQIEERSAYIKLTDPYSSPVAVRTSSATALTAWAPITTLDVVSLQTDSMATIADATASWRAAGYIVTSDQQGLPAVGVKPDAEDPTHDEVRTNALWGNLMAGGSGVGYYFGTSFAESDVSLQDFRSRDALFAQSKVALDFFASMATPLTPSNALVNPGNWCLSSPSTLVVYQQAGNAATVTVTASYQVQWYNPRTGGALQTGSVASIDAGTAVSLGTAPTEATADWVVVLTAV